MCGICGYASNSSSPEITEGVLRAMCDVMAHRGPDGSGIYRDSVVGLGHRRLSIIDVEGGHQPLANEDQSVWIVYNGETYNHLELRAQLEAKGHRYCTRCDTETLAHLYEEEGDELVHRLRGMCAFAIWDTRRRRLLLARDRLGIKPLYYTQVGGLLLFASEIKSLLASGLIEARLNYQALPEFLALGYNVEATTLFQGIYKVPPAHRLVWEEGRITIDRYWDVVYPAEPQKISEAEAVQQFRELFRDCVKMRLMSDVPLGVFLSGGIDSSAIAAAMATLVSEPIKTFSVGFNERRHSELPYAREMARSIGADHHDIIVEPSTFFDELPNLIWHEDEPIRWPSSVPLYFVSKLASQHVKVVLTGEGSDEIMGGYFRYWATLKNDLLSRTVGRVMPEQLRKQVLGRLVWYLPAPLRFRRQLWHTIFCRSDQAHDLIFDNFYGIFDQHVQQRLLTDGAAARLLDRDPWRSTLAFFNSGTAHTLLDRMLYSDMKTYMVELLMKQDQMSMATSVESRVPFLDYELVQFCASLPAALKINGVVGKYLLRRALGPDLPPSMVTRKKMGFPVPLQIWFAGDFNRRAREILTDAAARSAQLFQARTVHRILDEHFNRRRDWSEQIWLMINTELWLQRFNVQL